MVGGPQVVPYRFKGSLLLPSHGGTIRRDGLGWATHHDPIMRTPEENDPESPTFLPKEAQRSSPSPKAVRTRAHDFGFKPGIDLCRLNELAGELELEAFRERFEAHGAG